MTITELPSLVHNLFYLRDTLKKKKPTDKRIEEIQNILDSESITDNISKAKTFVEDNFSDIELI